MKELSRIIILTFLLLGSVAGCKKDDTGKDYEASISNKDWWGTFAYTSQATEFYCIHFNSDNSLLWSEQSRDYSGTWTLNGKQLTMTFPSSEIKADISDDDKLINFTDNALTYDVRTCELIPNPSIPIENTIWKGEIPSGATLKPLQFSFKPGKMVELKLWDDLIFYGEYVRSASGAVIKFFARSHENFTQEFFCIITSPTAMKGMDKSFNVPWQATKQ